MSTQTKIKLIVTIIVLSLSAYFLYPTIYWYTLNLGEQTKLEKLRDKILGKIINLGLDLSGGTHLVLELDDDRLPQGSDPVDALNRAIEIIRNRVDQLGVREPLIVRQGERWIVVQLPGLKDPQTAKELIGKTALLEFRLVDQSGAIQTIDSKRRELNLAWDEIYVSTVTNVLKPEFLTLFPTGYVLMPGKEESYQLVKSTPELTGAYLTNAEVRLDGDYGFPYVSLNFNKDGGKLFATVTGNNINRNLAIVLDGIVQSAPVIRSRIPDGKAIIEGRFSIDDVKNLAIILRAGALPAPVRIIEERTVGPSLGRDSITAGIVSVIIGGLLVFLFMALYYNVSGLIADVALLLNLFILLGLMCYLKFTLTLPGIAGIILTIGMAVDANVLIFERIREEIKQKKTIRVAIDQGYQKAFWTIFDSNLTTLIAAVFLFQFGTGPVKGFAVTLSLGLIISMFTAIVVTKLIYELWLQGHTVEKLSI